MRRDPNLFFELHIQAPGQAALAELGDDPYLFMTSEQSEEDGKVRVTLYAGGNLAEPWTPEKVREMCADLAECIDSALEEQAEREGP